MSPSPIKNEIKSLRERCEFSLLFNTFAVAFTAAYQFHRKIGGIEEGRPRHVLFKLEDCNLFIFSAAALFTNSYFRRDLVFSRLRPSTINRRNSDFIKQS